MNTRIGDKDTIKTEGKRAGVPFSFGRLAAIAENTFREAVRQRLFALMVMLSVGLVVSARFFREFNFGSSELKFIADFGFGALVLFGSTLTITATAQLFFSEIENRTALTLLAKPVWRTEFIFGKLLGVLAVIGVFCVLTTTLLAGLLWQRETALMAAQPESFASGRVINYVDVLLAGGLQGLKFGVLAAFTLLIASFARSGLFTVISGFLVLVICHLQYLAQDAYAKVASPLLQLLVRGLGLAFPNFQIFNVTDQVVAGSALDGLMVARVVIYAVAYMVVIGGLAVYSFRSREI
jgi:ABC-type transport system involved in multi-copper enzyme maturation permease subunit